MGEFLDRATGIANGGHPGLPDEEELAEATQVLLMRACNKPGGGGVRDIGDKMIMEVRGAAVAVSPRGKADHIEATFRITVERTK
jgi:hypothetical protein